MTASAPATGTSASGRQSTSMPTVQIVGDQPAAEAAPPRGHFGIMPIQRAHRPRRADRPANAAVRAAAHARPPDPSEPARRVPTASRNARMSSVNRVGLSTLRLNRIKPHGRAARARSRVPRPTRRQAGNTGNESARSHRRGLTAPPPRVKARNANFSGRRTGRRPISGFRRIPRPRSAVANGRPWHGIDAFGTEIGLADDQLTIAEQAWKLPLQAMGRPSSPLLQSGARPVGRRRSRPAWHR